MYIQHCHRIIFITCLLFQNGLAEFYEKSSERNGEKGWPSFGTMLLGGVAVMALGAIFTQKS